MKWKPDLLDQKIDCTPFTWKEALSQGNTGIVNPTEVECDNIIRQAHALDPVSRLLGGFRITSWLRTVEHNKSVGGAVHSMHLTGLATDFVPLHMNPEEARQKIKLSGVYPGRGEENTKTWVHLDLKNSVWFTP